MLPVRARDGFASPDVKPEMKTRCPICETIFRITPEQLKARAGNVRCGQCQTVFNALDTLLENETTEHGAMSAVQVASPQASAQQTARPPKAKFEQDYDRILDSFHVDRMEGESGLDKKQVESLVPDTSADIDLGLAGTDFREEPMSTAPYIGEHPTLPDGEEIATESVSPPPPDQEGDSGHEMGKAAGLILPRETTEIPGYSKWAEGVVTPSSIPGEASSPRWPFALAAILLVLVLIGQLAFHFRGELAVSAPVLRPPLEAFSRVFDADIPLPTHVELVSIENSDLQADPARGNMFVLNATLRNRARYAQALPSLELSLTDTQDAAVVRRVFRPDEYLPKSRDHRAFPGNSDIAVRLWIETKDVSAAGYRLYVFYP